MDGVAPTEDHTPVDPYDFWLFDLDGTLVDVPESYARGVFDEVGRRLDTAFTDEEVAVLWHGLRGARNDTLRRAGIDPERFWTVFHQVEDPAARARATYLYDDARFVVDLEAPVGVVTHCQRYLTDAVLDELGVRDWFDAVVCCDADLGWKPNPAPVHRALADMGVAESAAAADGGVGRGVLVGDGPGDVGAAWNAGLDAVHVERHSHALRGQCVRGDYRVGAIDQLPHV